MAFYKVTYNEKYRFATVHNYGCTFRCPICSYKLKSGEHGKPGHAYPPPERYLEAEEIKGVLKTLDVDKLYFMGGEPTVAKDLQEIIDFAKEALGVPSHLGHTNGSRLPLPNLKGANVGLKAWDDGVHLAYTGKRKKRIFDNFDRAYRAGMELKANVVYVPGLVDLDQIESIAAWIAGLDREIPFHIMGYIPVPGQKYERPTAEQMKAAEAACRRHLRHVAFSHMDPESALHLSGRDDRFAVTRLL
ncbi:MAG: radical SAM protein [Deltaproteobacteria bacterium]|nr:radical SAM protein [Deltaproteobacteria bacterium]